MWYTRCHEECKLDQLLFCTCILQHINVFLDRCYFRQQLVDKREKKSILILREEAMKNLRWESYTIQNVRQVRFFFFSKQEICNYQSQWCVKYLYALVTCWDKWMGWNFLNNNLIAMAIKGTSSFMEGVTITTLITISLY